MTPTASTTTWCAKRVVPKDYDSVPHLATVARRAGMLEVEFDWAFSDAELRELRLAVFAWSRDVVGRYRAFDALVLTAINDVLAEPNSAYFRKAPKNASSLNFRVAAVREGQAYRLQGRATFNVVLGYAPGEASATPFATLSPQLCAKLNYNIGLLGWDCRKLREDRCAEVRCALFGVKFHPTTLPPDHKPELDLPLELCFEGPFTFVRQQGARCVFDDPVADKSGVYIHTLPHDGREYVSYIGQARRTLGVRTGEHVAAMLAGNYAILDFEAFCNGQHLSVWRGADVEVGWPGSFLERQAEIGPKLCKLLTSARLHFASLPDNCDQVAYNAVEGALGRHFARLEAAGAPVSLGLNRVPARSYQVALHATISAEGSIVGLPGELHEA
jgi:hypothetical protein